MKRFINWIKNPSSDFALFVIVLVLANIISINSSLRFDLTSQKSYSISQASKQTVSTLSQPLSIKVFFSDNLPSPYNTVQQYIKDILVEYKGVSNSLFSYAFFDMQKPENQQIASSYGLRQIRIQEVKNDEVGFKQVWMGLAISYGDSIEVIDAISNSDGFEYKLTTTISKMISKANTLSLLDKNEKISVKLYTTEKFDSFRINGYKDLDSNLAVIVNELNKSNQNLLSYTKEVIPQDKVDSLYEQYGLQVVTWKEKDGTENKGVFGLIVEYNNKYKNIPLAISSSFFGNAITGLDKAEENISESIANLLSKVTEVGYIQGHNEVPLINEQGEELNYSKIMSDSYTLKTINLQEEDIPLTINTIIINGSKTAFTDDELYKIDQFLMKGGNLALYTDPFEQIQNNYGQQVEYIPTETKLDTILEKYGVKVEKNYIFDEECYNVNDGQYGNVRLYWAPVVQKRQTANKNPITKNLGFLIFLQNGSIDVSKAQENKDIKTTILAKSSPKSWVQYKNIQLYPTMQRPADRSIYQEHNLAVLLEGKFTSAFENGNPSLKQEDSNQSQISATEHINKAVQSGKIVVINSSYVTSNQVNDEEGQAPITMFNRNIIDYLNGNEDLCQMRTKGVMINTLHNTNTAFALIIKYFNQYGIALIIGIVGLIIWRLRVIRRKAIHDKYNPNDKREIVKTK